MSGMKCWVPTCRKPITGNDWKRRVEWRKTWAADAGSSVLSVFGPGMPDGELSEASGTLVQVSHYKCYFAQAARQRVQAAKADDPSAQSPRERDWRDQEIAEVEDLREGDRGHRGT